MAYDYSNVDNMLTIISEIFVQLRKAMYEFLFLVPWLQIRLTNVKKSHGTFKGSIVD